MEIPPDSIRHDGFPDDGRVWWIRWADRIDPGDPTGSPTIELLLSPIGAAGTTGGADLANITEDLALGELRRRDPECSRVKIHVSSIPLFPLGALLLGGRRCGDLPIETREYSFDGKWKSDFLPGSHRNPAPKPSWWTNAWNVLPAGTYPRGDNRESFLVVLSEAAGPKQVVIPSYEIFRTFYATNTRIADALLSGPWSLPSGRDRIVNVAHTGILPDGTWQIGLRNGLARSDAWPVSNLTMTDFGSDCAVRLTDEFARDRRLWKQHARIKADIPFRWSALRLRVEGFSLYDPKLVSPEKLDKFIVLRIAEVLFPSPPEGFPPRLVARLDNNNVVATRPAAHGEEARPPIGQANLVPDGDGVVRVSADISPSLSAKAVEAALDVHGWAGLAVPELVREGPGEKASPGIRAFSQETLLGSTAGRPASSQDVGRLSGRATGALRGDHVFDALARSLEDLASTGKIDHWKSVTEIAAGGLPVFRPGYVVLRIPTEFARRGDGRWDALLRQWITPSRGRFRGRHRKVMIAEVDIKGRRFHCLEIEPLSSGGGYCLAIAEFGGESVRKALSELVAAAVRCRGV